MYCYQHWECADSQHGQGRSCIKTCNHISSKSVHGTEILARLVGGFTTLGNAWRAISLT